MTGDKIVSFVGLDPREFGILLSTVEFIKQGKFIPPDWSDEEWQGLIKKVQELPLFIEQEKNTAFNRGHNAAIREREIDLMEDEYK